MSETRTLSASEWELWRTWMEAQRALAAEVDRSLQAEVGVSKAEFSVLLTLQGAPGATLRVGDLATALRWEKSRVSHLLSRMERRGFVSRAESGAPGRRTAISLNPEGSAIAAAAIRVHDTNVRRLFFDRATVGQVEAIRAWSEQTLSSARDDRA